MPTLKHIVPVVMVVLSVFGGTPRAAERVALVIGNAAYEHTTALRNPRNDAADMARVLEGLGFEVIKGLDLDERAFEKKLREFSRAARGAEVTLFFYAGHGLQVEDENYLVPTDAKLAEEVDLRLEAFELAAFLGQMRGETNLVFLDACRDNPLARTLARSMGPTRSSAIERGLSRVETARGTLIAYATQPGNVADDGEGRNSPFTAALLAHIATLGLSVNDMLTSVSDAVVTGTNGRQQPWTHTSLRKPFYFNPVDSEVAPPTGGRFAPDGVPAEQLAAKAYEAAERLHTVQAYEVVVSRFPGSAFAELAREQIGKFKAEAERREAARRSDDKSYRDILADNERLASLSVTARKVVEENRDLGRALKTRVIRKVAEAGEIGALQARIRSNRDLLDSVIVNVDTRRKAYAEIASNRERNGEDTTAFRKQLREMADQIELLGEYRNALEEVLNAVPKG